MSWSPPQHTNRLRACFLFLTVSMMAALSAACMSASATLGAAIGKIAPKGSAAVVRVHYQGVCTELVYARTTQGSVLVASRSFPSPSIECVGEVASGSTGTVDGTPGMLATVVSSSTVRSGMPSNTTLFGQ